jgi:hypothetical protein
MDEQNFSPGASAPAEPEKVARTFRLAAVLASGDDLVEVGVDGTVIATPSAVPAKKAGSALDRGVAASKNIRSDG